MNKQDKRVIKSIVKWRYRLARIDASIERVYSVMNYKRHITNSRVLDELTTRKRIISNHILLLKRDNKVKEGLFIQATQ